MRIDLEPIIDRLEDKKEAFIAECREAINYEVNSRGRKSLSIREVGMYVHDPALDDYLAVLYRFCRRKTYRGHNLESVLVAPISEAVYEKYKKFLNDSRPEIEAALKEQLAESVDLQSVLQKVVFEQLRDKGVKEIQRKAVKTFVHSCQSALHAHLAHATNATVSHVTTTAVGSTVGTSIAHTLSLAISHAVAVSLVQAMSSVAIKAMLKTAIVHSAGALVTAVVIKLVVAKCTAAGGSALLGPIAFMMAGGFVLHKIITLPETLGNDLGNEMAAMLRGEFRPWTRDALQSCFDKMMDPEAMLKEVTKAEVDAQFSTILKHIDSLSTDPPQGYEKVGKDAKKIVGYGQKAVNEIKKRKE